MIYIELLCLAVIIVFITDLSGVVPNIKQVISKVLTKNKIKSDEWRFHPLDCSLCQMHWIGLIYIICQGQFNLLNYMILCLIAFLTPEIGSLLLLCKDLFNMIIKKINDIL